MSVISPSTSSKVSCARSPQRLESYRKGYKFCNAVIKVYLSSFCIMVSAPLQNSYVKLPLECSRIKLIVNNSYGYLL